jgi:hypothetical protein
MLVEIIIRAVVDAISGTLGDLLGRSAAPFVDHLFRRRTKGAKRSRPVGNWRKSAKRKRGGLK